MAGVIEYHIPRYGARRVLVVAEDRGLRSRLRSEFELAGCEVTAQAHLQPAGLSRLTSYDVVVADAAAFPPANRQEALRALRVAAPRARLALLVGPQERGLAEQAQQIGFDLVREHPTAAAALHDLIREAVGAPPAQVEAVPVPMDLEFLPTSAAGWSKRRPAAGPPIEAAPVAMDFEFLLERAPGTGRRRAPTGVRLEPLPVSRELKLLLKPTEITGERRASSALTGLGIHALVLVVALLVPLWFTDTFAEAPRLTQAWLAAPPPPPPPPPPASKPAVQAARPKMLRLALERKLSVPTTIPKEIAQIVDPREPDAALFSLAGVPGGVPGGQLGGVIGGVLSAVAPPVEAPRPQKPVRVGGEVRPPRLVKHVNPTYPPVAKLARLEGEVRVDAVIDPSGRVVEMKVLTGHPLLAQAVMDAMRQWLYEPTYLNGQPVPIRMEITVAFNLS